MGMGRIDITSLVAAGLLEEVSLDEGVGAFAMQLVQSRVCLGEHVLQLVGVLVDLCLDHAIGLHVVNLAVVLLVLFLVDGEGRFTYLRGLDIPEVCLLRNLRPLALVEVGKVVADDGDGQGDHQHPADGAHRPNNLPQTSDWRNVTVTNRGHCDKRPPVGVQHGEELPITFSEEKIQTALKNIIFRV